MEKCSANIKDHGSMSAKKKLPFHKDNLTEEIIYKTGTMKINCCTAVQSVYGMSRDRTHDSRINLLSFLVLR